MKVKIGKYNDRLVCNIHNNYMMKKYDLDWPDEDTKFESFLESLDDKIQSIYNIFNWIYFDRRKRTVNVKIDQWDTWNMDETLAHIILPMLKQLKVTMHGYPADLTEEEWHEILNKMIFSFESKLIDWEDQFYSGEPDIVWTKAENSKYFTMDRGPNDTFEIDHKGLNEYQKRINEGFMLFGKYYENLWD